MFVCLFVCGVCVRANGGGVSLVGSFMRLNENRMLPVPASVAKCKCAVKVQAAQGCIQAGGLTATRGCGTARRRGREEGGGMFLTTGFVFLADQR